MLMALSLFMALHPNIKELFMKKNFLTVLIIALSTLLFAAPKGTLYVGTSNGLSISTDNGKTFTVKTTADGIGDKNIYDIGFFGSKLYLVTKAGLSISADGAGTFTNIPKVEGKLVTDYASKIYVENELIMVSSTKGISISTDGGKTFTLKSNPQLPLGVNSNKNSRIEKKDNIIFIANGLGVLMTSDNGTTFTGKNQSDGLVSKYIITLFIDQNNIYIGQAPGLSVSTNNGASFTTLNKSLKVDALCASGNKVYVCSMSAKDTRGVYVSNDGGKNFVRKTTANGLGSNNTYAITTAENFIFVGTAGGLSISTDGGENFVTKKTADGLSHNLVMSLLFVP